MMIDKPLFDEAVCRNGYKMDGWKGAHGTWVWVASFPSDAPSVLSQNSTEVSATFWWECAAIDSRNCQEAWLWRLHDMRRKAAITDGFMWQQHYRGRQDTCMVHLCCKFYKAVDDKSTVQFALRHYFLTFTSIWQHPKLHEEIKLSKSSERYQQVMLYVKWQEVEPRLYFSYDCSMIQSIVHVPLNSHGTVPKPQPQVDCVRVT